MEAGGFLLLEGGGGGYDQHRRKRVAWKEDKRCAEVLTTTVYSNLFLIVWRSDIEDMQYKGYAFLLLKVKFTQWGKKTSKWEKKKCKSLK